VVAVLNRRKHNAIVTGVKFTLPDNGIGGRPPAAISGSPTRGVSISAVR